MHHENTSIPIAWHPFRDRIEVIYMKRSEVILVHPSLTHQRNQKSLTDFWFFVEQISSRRMHAAIPLWMPFYSTKSR
jgi:hypothetical protein